MGRPKSAIGWLALLALTSGCGGSERSAQAAGFRPAQPPPGAAPATMEASASPPPPNQPAPGQPATPTQPGQVPPLGAILSDPAALQNIIAGALSGTSASLSALTGGEQAVLVQGIKLGAQTHARGMKSEGELLSAKLAQGGHAEATVSLQPGGCYTVIGFGGAGVFAYQINLISSPPLPPQVLAQSAADGNSPVVGPNEQCIRNPYPLPMRLKVDMHVVRGQGLVGAQLFRK